jgi:protein-tyrosine phosphatase
MSQQRAPLQTDFVKQQTFLPVPRPSECDFVTKGLYIGTESAARNTDLLRSLQITHIVNLNGYEAGGGFPDGFEYRVVKMRDSAWETLTDEFWSAVEFAKDAIEKGGSVLVHCRCGIVRSAALCIAYLMDVQGLSVEAALALLKEQRPVVNPPQGFLDQLRERAAPGRRPESGRKRMLPPSVLVALAGKGRAIDSIVPDCD